MQQEDEGEGMQHENEAEGMQHENKVNFEQLFDNADDENDMAVDLPDGVGDHEVDLLEVAVLGDRGNNEEDIMDEGGNEEDVEQEVVEAFQLLEYQMVRVGGQIWY